MLTIIQDTREQKVLEFTSYRNTFNVIRDTLYAADYGCRFSDDSEMPVAFERKSIADLFGTLTKGMERFKRELKRASDGGLKLVLIIEGTMSDVLAGIPHSQVEGKSILKTVFTLWVKYDLMPVFCPNRSDMEKFITETFSAIARSYKPKDKVAQSTENYCAVTLEKQS